MTSPGESDVSQAAFFRNSVVAGRDSEISYRLTKLLNISRTVAGKNRKSLGITAQFIGQFLPVGQPSGIFDGFFRIFRNAARGEDALNQPGIRYNIPFQTLGRVNC